MNVRSNRGAPAAGRAVIGLALALAGAAMVVSAPAKAAPGGSGSRRDDPRRASLPAAVNRALGLRTSTLQRLGVDVAAGGPLRVNMEAGGGRCTLDLRVHSVRGERYQVFLAGADGRLEEVPPGPVNTLRGVVREDPGSSVSAGTMDEGLYGAIEFSDGERFGFQPVARALGRVGDPSLRDLYVVYNQNDVARDDALTCGSNRNFLVEAAPRNGMGRAGGGGTFGRAGDGAGDPAEGGDPPYRCEIACDADFAYFQNWGGQVEARINLVLNTMDDQYRRDVNIRHDIVAIIIRTSQIYTTSDAEGLLNQFRNQWNANHTDILRDIAHLFTGRNLSGNTIGIAWIGVICSNRFSGLGYSLVQSDFNNVFSCATDLSAHELGHNWGADHCSCPTFTMNPSITCRNRFEPVQTIPDIIALRDSRNCLDRFPETPDNDNCSSATGVGDGSFPYETTNATSDGPALPASCNEGGGNSFVKDVWFDYLAPCTGMATASVCASDFDTRLAVYEDGNCPGPLTACNDNACGDGGTRSEVSFVVTAGVHYLVRVGGGRTTGSGTLVLSCQEGQPCPEDLDGSGSVDFADVLQVLTAWGPCGACPEDLDDNGSVDFADVLLVLTAWGPCP